MVITDKCLVLKIAQIITPYGTNGGLLLFIHVSQFTSKWNALSVSHEEFPE